MQDINLRKELERTQLERKQASLVQEALSILNLDSDREMSISGRIKSTTPQAVSKSWTHLLDEALIFDVETIEVICVKYRLRFLESRLFKGEVPAEAIRAVKRIETELGIRFTKFRIIAPADRFRLRDSTKDPILLAELPNGKYYYLFQWGDDMSWFQHVLKYPFRHIGTLGLCSLVFGAMVCLLVPTQFESFKAEFFYRFFMFSMSSALVMTLSIIVGIMYSKDFSENVWNSKFLR